MRSEYSWIPVGESAGRTEPNQVGVSFTNHRAAVYESDGKTVQADIAAGAVFVTGDDPITWMRVGETTEALEIFPDPDLLPSTVQPVSATRDGTVLAISSMLRRVHAAGTDLSDVEASTLAHRLATHLIEQYSSSGAAEPPRGRLDRATVDRVAQYVDASLSEELTIDALAAVAALSPFHFARAFKASTGLAPHQFVTARRVDRAKTLLLDSKASVVDVAHAVGMSNVSHFRRVFRRHLGVLPGQLRAK
jgi:AraC family transcriptional regulator